MTAWPLALASRATAFLLALQVTAAPPPEDAREALARALALHKAGSLEAAVASYRGSLALEATDVQGFRPQALRAAIEAVAR